METLNYLFLKHIKPVEARQGTMMPALRLIKIAAWMLVIVQVALLGAMVIHPLTRLIAGWSGSDRLLIAQIRIAAPAP